MAAPTLPANKSNSEPLIPEKYLDVPSQRLYYLSLGLLCQVSSLGPSVNAFLFEVELFALLLLLVHQTFGSCRDIYLAGESCYDMRKVAIL